ncbi:Fasciclin-like arabinogalactan protein 2 [Salvia divinorum]|uniref:Fasciclin-like arabinogalactan protein 2 n=1 Tax=Salvia divinorum TaxID=28513 RepID=A0ABD1IFT4_SALDI
MKLINILLLLVAVAVAGTSEAHNITRILGSHPSLSTFNHYLSITRLADEINRRRTITVCAVDNAAMSSLLSHQYPLPTLKNILSLHVFADYFGSKKLHQITKGSTTTSTLFQASGEAAGTSGYVNITDFKGGKVGFTPVDSDSEPPMATFVKSIHELPYNISVIQISNILTSPEAEAPVSAPTDLNLLSLLAKQGCKSFSDLIAGAGAGVADVFTESVEAGLTVFCPSDAAIKSFSPSYKNLTSAGKTSLLLYHGVPEYNSLGMLRVSNGLMRTLATEGTKKFDFTVATDGDDVKLQTGVVTATIKGTVIDEDPLAIFKIDKVLLPAELFKADPAAKAKAGEAEDAPGPARDDDVPADEDSNDGGLTVVRGGGIVALSVAFVFGVLFV